LLGLGSSPFAPAVAEALQPFKLFYCFFVFEHRRRRVLPPNVTRHPASEWIVQQLREASPETGPYRYVILDRVPKSVFLARSGVGPPSHPPICQRRHEGSTAVLLRLRDTLLSTDAINCSVNSYNAAKKLRARASSANSRMM
jgi:hypothetical protein